MIDYDDYMENHSSNNDIDNETEQEDDKIEGSIGDIKFETKSIEIKRILKKHINQDIIRKFNIRIEGKEIDLQPKFQRYYVWDIKKATLLMESILLGIPLPIVYVAEEQDGSLVVVDGQQRLQTILYFINGEFKQKDGRFIKFKLRNNYLKTNDSSISDLSFDELDEELQKNILDYKLTVSTIKKESKPDLKYEMFFRLNQGAMPLNNMEMRCSQFRGKYLELIEQLADNEHFVNAMGFYDINEENKGRGRKKKSNKPNRKEDLELILEFLAIYDLKGDWEKYTKPKKIFLTKHMEKYSDEKVTEEYKHYLLDVFNRTFEIIYCIFRDNAFRIPKTNKRTGEKIYSSKHNNFLYTILSYLITEYLDYKNDLHKNATCIRDSLEPIFKEIDSPNKNSIQDYKYFYYRFKQTIDAIIYQKEEYEQKYNNEENKQEINCNLCEYENKNETKMQNIDIIYKYKDLLDKGIITQEEFTIKKKEILGL